VSKGKQKRSAKHVDQNANNNSELWASQPSSEVGAGAHREQEEVGGIPQELLEAKLEVVTDRGERHQIPVALEQIPNGSFALAEASSGPIPPPQIYKQYPTDVQNLIKDTYRAIAIEPSRREDQFTHHVVVLAYLGFFGTVILFLMCLALALYFFIKGNNWAGTAFISTNVLGVAAAIFNPSLLSFGWADKNKGNKEDE